MSQSQDIVYDTTKIREQLGFHEVIDERIGMAGMALEWRKSAGASHNIKRPVDARDQ